MFWWQNFLYCSFKFRFIATDKFRWYPSTMIMKRKLDVCAYLNMKMLQREICSSLPAYYVLAHYNRHKQKLLLHQILIFLIETFLLPPSFLQRRGNIFFMRWSGTANVYWNDEYGEDVSVQIHYCDKGADLLTHKRVPHPHPTPLCWNDRGGNKDCHAKIYKYGWIYMHITGISRNNRRYI